MYESKPPQRGGGLRPPSTEGACGALYGFPLWGLAFLHSACLTSSEDIKIHQNASRFMPIHPSHVLRGTLFRETFSEICTLTKKHFLMFFERNPLPGSDSARHLEPRETKSATKRNFKKCIPVFGPKCPGAGMFTAISRNDSVVGALTKNNLTDTKETWPCK